MKNYELNRYVGKGHIPYKGIGPAPIDTSCKCHGIIRMYWNGNFHSGECSNKCGVIGRIKGADMIIEKPTTITNPIQLSRNKIKCNN